MSSHNETNAEVLLGHAKHGRLWGVLTAVLSTSLAVSEFGEHRFNLQFALFAVASVASWWGLWKGQQLIRAIQRMRDVTKS